VGGAIAFYNHGGGEDLFGTKSPLLKPLPLSAAEQAALRAFLQSLNGDEILVEPPLPSPRLGFSHDSISAFEARCKGGEL